jgi:beta-glucanase (GH16 family)
MGIIGYTITTMRRTKGVLGRTSLSLFIVSLSIAISLSVAFARPQGALEPTQAQTPAVIKPQKTPLVPKKPKIDLTKFKMTFQDEFNGTQLDTTKWEAPEMPRQGSSRWVKSMVRVEKGLLHLGVKLTNDPVLRYDCAAIRTQRNYDPNQTLFQQRYGYFETRCKLPKNLKGDYWGAFWMMCGKVGDQTPDTRNGLEVDILETFHFTNKNANSMTFHWNGYGDKHNVAGSECAPTPQALDGKFHRYGLYWDEKYYVAFFDGVEVGRTEFVGMGSKENGKTLSSGPCQQPGYVKLSTEAAAWVGATSGWEKEMATEDDFVVDYVRVYEGKLSEVTTSPPKAN